MEKTSKWIVNSVISSMYQLIKLDCSCATSFAPLLKTSQLSHPTGRSPRFGSFLPVFICQRSCIITCHLFIIIIIIITSIHNRNRFFQVISTYYYINRLFTPVDGDDLPIFDTLTSSHSHYYRTKIRTN